MQATIAPETQAAATTILANHQPGFFDDYIQKRIAYWTGELAATFDMTAEDRECLGQDMAFELLKADERFDPSIAGYKTFVNGVLERFCMHVIRGQCRRLECPAACPDLFEDIAEGFSPVDNDPALGEFSAVDKIDLCLDAQAVIASMPEDLQAVCRHLMAASAGEAMVALDMTKDAYTRAVERIREHFLAHGISETLRVAD